MIRNSQSELLLTTQEYAKASPVLFNDKNMFIEGISVCSPDGSFGPLHVTGEPALLDIIEALIKEN